MSISTYQACMPSLFASLKNLDHILARAQAFSDARKVNASVLLNYRLAPDMFPLSTQVQIACDTAKGCGARLAGVDMPRYEDNEADLAQLRERVAKTLSFLKGLAPEKFEGAEERTIELKFPNSSYSFTGLNYINHFVMPNFYFHMTCAYAILRHCGVELGKSDYLQGAVKA